MTKSISLILVMIFLLSLQGNAFSEATPPPIKLGSDLLLSKYHYMIDGKNIGLITNETAVNSEGKSILDVLKDYPQTSLKAVFTPEQEMETHTSPTLNIPIYDQTSVPTKEMLQEVDVFIFDIQVVEEGTYHYISALNDFMMTAKQNNKSVIVLDRLNTINREVAGELAGADILSMVNDMTAGEIAQYLNQKIGADLTVIPMEGYTRSIPLQDTGWTKYLIYGQAIPPQPEPQPQLRKVQLNGGLSVSNKSYVPLKSVLQEFGYQIGWESATKKVYAEKPGKIMVIQTAMSPMKVWVNGIEVKSKDIVPMIKGGITYIPAQFIPWIEKSQQKTVGNQVQIESANLSIVVGITEGIPAKQTAKPSPKKQSGKIAYLTFDDGPSLLTPQILDILKKTGVKATFFVIGRNIKGYESVLKRAVAEGHAIGGHSYSHNYDVIYHDVGAFFQDIEKGQKAIEQVTGKKSTVFRFPGGSNNSVSKKAQDPKMFSQNKWIMKDLVKEAAKRGYHYYDWNVSIGDASAQGYTAESALKNVQEEIKSKKEVVILSHDSAPKVNTVKALPQIIQLLKDEGYTFGTLDSSVEGFTFLR